jgi:hypothetical protein
MPRAQASCLPGRPCVLSFLVVLTRPAQSNAATGLGYARLKQGIFQREFDRTLSTDLSWSLATLMPREAYYVQGAGRTSRK